MTLKTQEVQRNSRRPRLWETSRRLYRKPRCARNAPRTENRVRSNELVILGLDGIVRTATIYTTRRCKLKYNPNLQEILLTDGEEELARASRFWYMGFVKEQGR